MADCNVILAIGTGADEPLSGSTIQIRRVEIGTKGNLEVLSAWKPYVLAEDATTIPLVQGVIYESRVMGVNGGEKVFEVPETTEAYYKDLVRVFPLPDGQNFGPQGPQGEVGPEGPAGPNSIPTAEFVGDEIADPTSPAGVAVAANIMRAKVPDTAITYDSAGNVLTVTENGITTTYTYNGDGSVATDSVTISGDTITRTYTYSGGNLVGIEAA